MKASIGLKSIKMIKFWYVSLGNSQEYIERTVSSETKFVHKLTIKRYFKVVNQCKIHKIKYNHVLPHKIL